MSGQVFVGRRAERELLHDQAKVAGVRSLLFLVGPSGIGKTALARSLASYSDIELVYVPYLEPAAGPKEAVEQLVRALQGTSLRAVLAAAVRDLAGRIVGENVAEIVGELVDRERTGLRLLYDLLSAVAGRAPSSRPLVLVIDEAQNMMSGLASWWEKVEEGWEERYIWSLVKILSSVQEENNNIRVIMVSSDYFFYEKVIGGLAEPGLYRDILPGRDDQE